MKEYFDYVFARIPNFAAEPALLIGDSLTSDIPKPKTYGPLGNLPLINATEPILSLMKLADEQGPIFRLERPGGSVIVVSGHAFVKEVCDESRFDKSIGGALEKVRAFAGDGLFTAETHEPNWRKAHHILMPSCMP